MTHHNHLSNDIMNYGRSVREFFFEDLSALAQHGYCLMPEWICQSMVDSVYAAHWQPLFYPVLSPKKANMILQADLQIMIQMLDSLSPPCAVLLAHPLGYIDPNCMAFLLQAQKKPDIHLFLDLSQSYGREDYLQEILNVHAAYFSFNGHKLIRTGGALRLCLTGGETIPLSVREIFTTFYHVATAQFETLENYLKSQTIENIIRTVSLYPFYQSSPYRTVLNWEKCSPDLQVRLKQQGLVQPLLAEPRQNQAHTSLNYRQWCHQVMLMFSSPRVEWSL